MKRPFFGLLLRYVALLVFAMGNESFAELPVRDGFGLRVAVNASGYRFARPDEEAISARGGAKTSFTASATITNGSRTAVPFNFPGNATAPRIVFKMFDSQGQELWRSEPEVPGGSVPQFLKPGASWKRTMRVPLVLESGPLPAGRYGLEAALANGDPVMASTLFEVAAPSGIPSQMNGLVLDTVYFPLVIPTAVHLPATGTNVLVQNEQASESQAKLATTGPDGRFTLRVMPGTYKVSAFRTLTLTVPVTYQATVSGTLTGPPIFIPGAFEASVKVTVSPGETSQPVVMMGTGATNKTLISGVGGVTANPMPEDTNVIVVNAAGVVPTGGWSLPDLISQELLPNGILLLDFIALPPAPGNAVTQAFEGVETAIRIPRMPGMKGVRVRSNTNAVTALLAE